MKYLSIDFGLSHLGFAMSNGDIAEPLKENVSYETEENLYKKTVRIIHTYQVENIVIGTTGGTIGEKARQYGDKLKHLIGLPVFYQNEDLSTQKAVSQMIEAGKKMSDRQTMDHNVAAANILQEFLDNLHEQDIIQS